MTHPSARRTDRASPNLFCLIGTAWVASDGLVAAVTGPLSVEYGSWVAAYQVLVGGLAQCGFGAAQNSPASQGPTRRIVAAELVAWNGGSLAVIAGTVTRIPLIVDAGGLLLIIGLVLMMRTVSGRSEGPRWALWTCWILLVVKSCSVSRLDSPWRIYEQTSVQRTILTPTDHLQRACGSWDPNGGMLVV